jgi:preprotein translocase subunit YajC
MLKFLCEAATDTPAGGDTGTRIIMTCLLVVVLIGMLIMPYFTSKRRTKEYEAMVNSLKAGDLVKTAGGIIGRIIKIMDKGEIKTVILETGSKTEKSYMEFDMNMIYCVLKSAKAEETAEEDEEDEESEEVVEETATEEATSDVETVAEVETVEEVAEEAAEETTTEEAKPEQKKYQQKKPIIKKTTKK